MNIGIRRAKKLFAACGGAALGLRLRRKRYNEKQAYKGRPPDWENEGGNLAPSPEATGTA